MRGGYKIIDLEGYTFTAGKATTVPGIHTSIEESLKPILLEGVHIGATDLKPCYISVKGGAPYTIDLPGFTMGVTASDNVTFTAKASA